MKGSFCMIKKQIMLFIVFLLIVPIVPISGNMNIINIDSHETIDIQIENTKDKLCIVDTIIGDIHVTYWQHIVNGIEVKNDSILLHKSNDSGKIITYERSWTDIDVFSSDYSELEFNPSNIFWKKLVVFPDEKDCSSFYHFQDHVNYPLVCWEVRQRDGSTSMYNTDGKAIGYGIPTPLEQGFSISNDCDNGFGDCWKSWRQNADKWFQKWCNSTINIGLPTIEEISSNIENHNTTFFFELGHSYYQPTRFYVSNGLFYNASHLQNDMIRRQPMKFAFIGSCEGLRRINSGTLSYEFRKGELNSTVTVGYVGMANCSGWVVSLDWQDYMFQQMDNGLTMKESFDNACAQYPTIANCVRFVGDEDLIVGNNPPSPPKKPLGNSFDRPNEPVYLTTSSFDPEADSMYYWFDWDDGTNSGWLGPYYYNDTVNVSHIWNKNGNYSVKVKAKDEHNVESEYSDSLPVIITNPPYKPETPKGRLLGKTKMNYSFTTRTIEPDEDTVFYQWNWGDGNVSQWHGPYSSGEKANITYTWSEKGLYDIKVKARDKYGSESDWSDPLYVTMTKSKQQSFSLIEWITNWLSEQYPLFNLFF